MKNLTTSLWVPPGVKLRGTLVPGDEAVLTPRAIEFVAMLERIFRAERAGCLQDRVVRQRRFDEGERPAFCPESQSIRQSDWVVPLAPPDLEDRRVEITGPVDRESIIHALNSGARVCMADFEDSLSPTWRNVLDGQANLFDAVRGSIAFIAAGSGRELRLNSRPATLMVRPRGWHLPENHVLVDGAPISATVFDFGMFFFHNAKPLIARGSGPYFYIPKVEGRREARLWNQMFRAAEGHVGIPRGTIRASVLVETIPAAFAMHEILWELREHSVGLSCGRWGYVFSAIKALRADPAFVLPDRVHLTMDQDFLRVFSQLLVDTCHRRRAHAIGDVASWIPSRTEPETDQTALEAVRADIGRQALDGHDGTRVAHPGLVDLATAEFDSVARGKDQGHRPRQEILSLPDALLRVPALTITEGGVRSNVRVVIQYLESWLRGQGSVSLSGRLEDAATVELARSQIWQWRRHRPRLDDGRVLDAPLIERIIDQETASLCAGADDARCESGPLVAAIDLLRVAVSENPPPDSLPERAYELITTPERTDSGTRASA